MLGSAFVTPRFDSWVHQSNGFSQKINTACIHTTGFASPSTTYMRQHICIQVCVCVYVCIYVCAFLSIRMPINSALQWRHNEHDGVSNHQPYDYLLNRLLKTQIKETSKLRVTGLCAGKSPGTGEFPAQMTSNAEMFPFDDVIMGFNGWKVARIDG